jgi:DNA-binding MarR family transcriptional regulator
MQPSREPPPTDAVVEAFLLASRALVGVAARSLAGVDVTLAQYRALVVVAGRPGLTVGDLAEALDVHPTTATRMCDRLVARRWLRRRTDDDDRRVTVLHLTASGRRLVHDVSDRRRRQIAEVVRRLDPADADAAVAALRAFSTASGEVPLEGDPEAWEAAW